MNVGATSKVFKDVSKSHPNYSAIMFLLDKGVIESSERFGLNDKVTREEMIVMLAKATGLDGSKGNTKFKDVSASRYSSGYINSAVKAGIINGYPDGTFKPTQNVTRGHMAAFTANAFKLGKEANINFKDVPKGSTSYNAVKKLAAENITSGYPDGTFKPNETLTRSHIAAFVARAMEPSFRPSNIKSPVKNPDVVVKPNPVGSSVLKGNLTWQYNKFIGTKPDTGATVHLFPKNAKQLKTADLVAIEDGRIDAANYGTYFAKADGYGAYEITNLPAGSYVAFYTSLKTMRNYMEPVNPSILNKLRPYVRDIEKSGISIFNHMVVEVNLKEKEVKTISKDWGYTY